MNPHRLARSLLRSLDVYDALRHSSLNYHALGLDYLCLLRTDRLTVKVYIADHARGCGNGAYLVNPHTHAYSFETIVLAGSVTNVLFWESPSKEHAPSAHRKYSYDPTTRTVVAGDVVMLPVSSASTYGPGNGYFLEHHEIHTIEVSASARTVLLLLQYEDEAPRTALYARPDAPPGFDRLLYQRPTREDVYRMARAASHALGAT